MTIIETPPDAQLSADRVFCPLQRPDVGAYRHDLRGFFQWASDTASLYWQRRVRTSSCTEAR